MESTGRTGRSLTRKGEATRERIVSGAAAEMRIRGVEHTSLDDVRAVTSTSKSQLFHYFPEGRSQLLLAVAQREADLVIEDQMPYLDDLGSWEAWQSWRDLVVERYRSQGQECPLSILLSQIGRGYPETQSIVVNLMRRWQGAIATGIRTMQAKGEVKPALDADRSAAALLAGIQGGVVVMLATGEITNLEAALDVGIASLRV
ncbi:MAG TPA: TetR/AcrR family transcriptional regulator [Thermomicrobiales bacterium]|nr:TetR/AcrR family transcriptional regulator [Thermomicrobiales bacterium]